MHNDLELSDEENDILDSVWDDINFSATPPSAIKTLAAAPATVPHVEPVTQSDAARWERMYQDIEDEVKRGKS